jgi:hypothetical protein
MKALVTLGTLGCIGGILLTTVGAAMDSSGLIGIGGLVGIGGFFAAVVGRICQ